MCVHTWVSGTGMDTFSKEQSALMRVTGVKTIEADGLELADKFPYGYFTVYYFKSSILFEILKTQFYI